MTQPLFDPNKCDIPEIPSLAFDFVSDCSVPHAPPPIFDCPPPVVPPDPPPLCPEFSARVRVNADYGGCSDQSDSAAIIFTKIDDDPCRFFVDLDLDLKIPRPPCPTFSVGSVAMVVEYADCLPPEQRGVAVVVTREALSCEDSSAGSETPCKFTLDLALGIPIPRIPCPEISVGEFSVNTNWADCITKPSALTITRNVPEKKCLTDGGFSESACEFTIDLDLQIPIPRIPCPTFSVTGMIAYGGDVPEMLVYAEVNQDNNACTAPAPGEEKQCQIDFGIDILIPCPEITATIDVTAITATSQPTGTLTVMPQQDPITNTTAPCKFEIELDLKIPQPCVPRFWCSARYPPRDCSFIELLPADQEPYINLTFEKTPGPFPPPNDCDYEIGLDIGIPLPGCPEMTATLDVTAITATEDPTGTLTITPSGPLDSTGPCQFNFDLELKIPKPCVPTFWCSLKYSKPGDTPGESPRDCSLIQKINGDEEPYINFAFAKSPNPFTDTPSDCDYEIGIEIGLPVTGVQIVTDITCVSGEIIVTKETIDVVVWPALPPL